MNNGGASASLLEKIKIKKANQQKKKIMTIDFIIHCSLLRLR